MATVRTSWGTKRRVWGMDIETRPGPWGGGDFTFRSMLSIAAGFEDDVDSNTQNPCISYLAPGFSASQLETFITPMRGERVLVVGHNACTIPSTRILTSDLRWIPAGDLVPGDRLLAFEESPSGTRRHWQFSEVIHNAPRHESVFAVELETGEVIHTTADHPWLVSTRIGPGAKYRWRHTAELLGALPRFAGMRHKGPVMVSRVLKPWDDDVSWGAGWLAGFFDGEGCLTNGLRKAQLSASQNPGPVLDLAIQLLEERGFKTNITGTAGRLIARLHINGGIEERLRFLGQIRPARLLDNFAQSQAGAFRCRENVRVVSVSPVGVREISGLETTSATYIAEGYAMHNCKYDLPLLNGTMVKMGLRPLGPQLVSDTYLHLVKSDYAYSKSLGNMAERFGGPSKGHLSEYEWEQIYEGKPEAMYKLRAYNVGDVYTTLALRRALLERGMLHPPRWWKP